MVCIIIQKHKYIQRKYVYIIYSSSPCNDFIIYRVTENEEDNDTEDDCDTDNYEEELVPTGDDTCVKSPDDDDFSWQITCNDTTIMVDYYTTTDDCSGDVDFTGIFGGCRDVDILDIGWIKVDVVTCGPSETTQTPGGDGGSNANKISLFMVYIIMILALLR